MFNSLACLGRCEGGIDVKADVQAMANKELQLWA